MRSTSSQRRQLDPVSTRAAIITSASKLFSERGFSGTSIGDIAKEANVTKSLVQYHFDSKETLWKQVLIGFVSEFIAKVDAFLEAEPSTERLVDLIEHRFQIFSKHPEILRMLSWAALDNSPIPEEALKRAPKVRQMITEMYADAPNNNEMANRLLLSFAAVDGWLTFKHVYSHLIGEDLSSETMNAAFIQHLLKTIWNRPEVQNEA